MPMLQRLARVFAAPAADPAMAALYHRCVAQAREPYFYQALGVPDTIDGRFDLLLLHVYLAMRELADMEAKQALFDLMFADMDESLREMGVGDMGIGKRMKPMIGAFYGRAQAYEKALMESDEALSHVLARNLYGKTQAPPEPLQAMTGYVRQAAAGLHTQAEEISKGRAEFPAV